MRFAVAIFVISALLLAADVAGAEDGDTNGRRWTVEKEKSPIDDSPTYIALLPSDELVPNTIGTATRPAFLVIRCIERKTAVLALFPGYLGTRGSSVTYRVDATPAQTGLWNNTTDGTAAGIFDSQRAIAFIKLLVPANQLVLRVPMFRGEQVTVTFKLAGLPEHVGEIRSACNWK